MTLRRQGVIDVFTMLGKENFSIWVSGIMNEGEYKLWHKNGKIWEHAFYKNGNLNGEVKSWHENGQESERAFYKNGNLNGEYKAWNENGKIVQHSFYKDGNIVKEIK